MVFLTVLDEHQIVEFGPGRLTARLLGSVIEELQFHSREHLGICPFPSGPRGRKHGVSGSHFGKELLGRLGYESGVSHHMVLGIGIDAVMHQCCSLLHSMELGDGERGVGAGKENHSCPKDIR